MARIGIDLDGVAYPFVETIQKFASKKFGVDMPPFEHWNDHEKKWGLTHEQLRDLMVEALRANELWWSGKPHDGFVQATADLYQAGHEIVIATDRLQGAPSAFLAETATRHWLRFHGVVYDELLFTHDKRDANADIFIEDRPKAVPTLRLAGVDAVYMDRPWNTWFPYPRVHSWRQFVRYVAQKTESKVA